MDSWILKVSVECSGLNALQSIIQNFVNQYKTKTILTKIDFTKEDEEETKAEFCCEVWFNTDSQSHLINAFHTEYLS